jgi:hypothetical protein
VNCQNHNQDCTFVQQTKKRPVKKDPRYTAKLEERNARLVAALEELAPHHEALRPDDRRSSGAAQRDPRTRPATALAVTDASALAVSAGAFLFTEGMAIGAYVGLSPCSPASADSRANFALGLPARDSLLQRSRVKLY